MRRERKREIKTQNWSLIPTRSNSYTLAFIYNPNLHWVFPFFEFWHIITDTLHPMIIAQDTRDCHSISMANKISRRANNHGAKFQWKSLIRIEAEETQSCHFMLCGSLAHVQVEGRNFIYSWRFVWVTRSEAKNTPSISLFIILFIYLFIYLFIIVYYLPGSCWEE